MAIERYRVKAGAKRWSDPGPDLLRPPSNAMDQLAAIIKGAGPFQYRRNMGPKVPAHGGEVMNQARKLDYKFFRVYTGDGSKLLASVKYERIVKDPVSCCSDDVSVLHSMVEYQFGADLVFAGGYVYKMEPGGYSDHAWGDAFDETPKAPLTNDKVFDWYVRMAQAGCTEYGYVIGSKDGKVHSASAPDYKVVLGGGDDTHLWHCHVSVINHHGAKPPKEGGYC